MRITVLRKMKYEKRFIYVLQFATTFQYLFAEDGDVYMHHFDFKPHWFGWLLWKLGLRKRPYTPAQLEDGEKIILSSAMETIDKISDPDFKKDDPEARQREEAQKLRAEQGDDKCQWQTFQGRDKKFYYLCLRHGQAVKMEEGQAPKHD